MTTKRNYKAEEESPQPMSHAIPTPDHISMNGLRQEIASFGGQQPGNLSETPSHYIPKLA
jgi:hypothetical protein